MTAKLPDAGLIEKLLMLVGLRKGVKISGDSMLPTLKDGDVVLFKTGKGPKIGDIVLARHPYKTTKIVKRLTVLDENGRATLAGDNPTESTDSRTFGSVSLEYIVGTATSRLKK